MNPTKTGRAALAAALILAPLPALTACSAIPNCTVSIAPSPSGLVAGAGVILGTVHTSCTLPVQEHHITVELQQYLNGAWTTDPNPDATARDDRKPPSPPAYNVIHVTAKCVQGLWHMYVTVIGSGKDGTPFSHSAVTQPTAIQQGECGH